MGSWLKDLNGPPSCCRRLDLYDIKRYTYYLFKKKLQTNILFTMGNFQWVID